MVDNSKVEEYKNCVKVCIANKDSHGVTSLIQRTGGGHQPHPCTRNQKKSRASRRELREELTNVLWAYRTTPRGSTGENPFSLVYGTEALIPAELGVPSHRILHFSEECNTTLLKENLDLIEKLRVKSFIRIQKYKNTMIHAHNKRVKTQSFQVGDLVLRRVDTLKPVEKLDPTWNDLTKIKE
ncbi:UNVERIFIED_CONTAM: hypothetical protein Sradi_2524000 [Sesamum radiatum]|uniref:Uncharacterized protein n=1 Tax=Sesamum radiatum TaxID=300843 RepID=A0AAW2SL74_SESRA